MTRFFNSSLSLVGLALVAASAHAQVKASLVAADASIQPGHVFTVALRLQPEPHWHTYWKFPGTGLPTSLTWELPPGFSTGAIQWPVPSVLRDADKKVIGYGYEGEVCLLVPITPPPTLPSGSSVTLKAHADWLMCKDVCQPGGADVQLTLPVATDSPAPDTANAALFATTRAALPQTLPAGWSATAAKHDGVIELRLNLTASVRPNPTSLYFFTADGAIDYEQPQMIRMTKEGYLLRLKTAPTDTPPTRLRGVLRSDSGWGEASAGPGGYVIDVPLAP